MNLIFCAYAYIEEFQSGHNIASQNAMDVYLKNSYVALVSAKQHNIDSDVALVTNVKLNQTWQKRFQEVDVKIFEIAYDEFIFSEKYAWSLAYYKLCAINHMIKRNYENYVMIDVDTYTQRPYTDIFAESRHSILLYDISRGLYNKDYYDFCSEAQMFLDNDYYLTRYGGEFIASNKRLLTEFMKFCTEIYHKIKETEFSTQNGDEFIISIAAFYMRSKIKNAAAYVFRYWTAYRWHYVSSNYIYNPVTVLHCPREKNYGFIKLFNIMHYKKSLPSPFKVYSALHLNLFSQPSHRKRKS